jgi:predicted lipoprotein
MRVNNPDAFVARIWSSFGLPFAPRKRSRSFELQKSALAREQAAGDAVNRALRTGDWGDALGYEQARIRGQVFKVDNLYALAKRNPELLEVILSASSR